MLWATVIRHELPGSSQLTVDVKVIYKIYCQFLEDNTINNHKELNPMVSATKYGHISVTINTPTVVTNLV